MQQHYQVINLHNIIKTQEIKIHELRQELQIINQREQNRYNEVMKKSNSILKEKQQLIEYLKEQLNKQQTNRNQELGLQRSRYEKDQSGIEKQLIIFKKKCIELEGKLRRTQNDMRILSEENAKEVYKLESQLNKIKEQKNNVAIEISKLNHFYKNSIFQIAKRKQTLLWVDKFTEYLQSQEKRHTKAMQDVENLTSTQIQSFRTQICNIINDITKSEQKASNSIRKEENEIGNQIKMLQANCQKAIEDNQYLWNQFIKDEQQSEKKAQIRNLTQQLQETRTRYEEELEKARGEIKAYEAEKKIFIVGFQQLRSLNEHRENTYRQQNKALKKTIQNLIKEGENRDIQFENQISMLTSQIQQISQRYDDNIQYPLNKISSRAENAHNQIKTIKESQNFSDLMNSMNILLRSYTESKDYQQLRTKVQCYITHSTTVLETLTTLMTCPNNFQKQPIEREALQIDRETKQIQNRQKLNKSIYEASLAKKHLAKLQSHCQQLEKRQHIELGPKKNSKIMALQAENEALKESIAFMKQSYEQELSANKINNSIITKQLNNISNTNQLLNTTIAKIKETNQTLLSFVTNQRKIFDEINYNVKSLKKLFSEPVKDFEDTVRIIHEFTQDNKKSRVLYSSRYVNEENKQKGSDQIIKQYKEILLKRSENYQSTQKYVTELIKALRQTQARHKHTFSNIQPKNQTKVKNQGGGRGLAKKLKQIQAQRMRQKQQYSDKLKSFESNLQKISSQMNKAVSMRQALLKFQSNFNIKIEDIIKKLQVKQNKSQLNNIREEVIIDLRAKLSQANIQCEALRKQMTIQLMNKRQ